MLLKEQIVPIFLWIIRESAVMQAKIEIKGNRGALFYMEIAFLRG